MNKGLLILALLVSNMAFGSERIRSYEVSVNPLKMNKIASQFEVVAKRAHGFEVYVQEEDVKAFLLLAPKAKLLQENIHVERDEKSLNQYRKYADVEADLKALVASYGTLATLETYGVSKGGRNLYALKISTGGENKPKVMVTAATHGDELITTEVLFSLTNELLSGYGKDQRLSKILNGRDIYIVPVVSPDSFEARERYVQRKDPNRSYPWPDKPNNPTVDVIQAMMDYTNKMKFTGSLDLHAYGKLVMYPWAYTRKAPAASDVVIFKDLVESMAKENQYEAGQISTTIYVAEGSSADYFYWKSGTRALAAELGREKIPSYSKIPSIVNESREMVWTFLESFN
nr:M14 family metallopeptidase [Bacteriovorax sp. HI3]